MKVVQVLFCREAWIFLGGRGSAKSRWLGFKGLLNMRLGQVLVLDTWTKALEQTHSLTSPIYDAYVQIGIRSGVA